MSYTGCIPLISDYCSWLHYSVQKPTLRILEIGVDTGQTTIPLIHNLIHDKVKFHWTGVDIRPDHLVGTQLSLMKGVHLVNAGKPFNDDIHIGTADYIISNSRGFLYHYTKDPNSDMFDVVLIDGDHNYDTVAEELSHLNSITHNMSLVICDDYGGKHAGKDDFYINKKSHANLKHVSKDLDMGLDKGGVTKAVDEFIAMGKNWNLMRPTQEFGPDPDPVILYCDLRWDENAREDTAQMTDFTWEYTFGKGTRS